ncbi:IclR family transcriptional regulator [Niallia nealsonii]|uniref:IclR family transcriptional regulator n=1 Tax=Niallia nealsonii TaxID=115979 RepID=A0A2N0Z1G7_9BACI|nr:IclR family transcriptional regulator [Niallia nealsonii]PKG23351.1 IclR family transcriptional regulator [Niallia nealsonii]
MSEVGTLKKGIDILWLIIEKGSLSVLEIMEILPYNRSTTYRLVSTLEQNHLIQKTTDNTYKMSNQLVEKLLSHDNNLNFDFDSSIVRAADEFKELTGETIFIGVLNGTNVLATHVILGRYPTRTHFEKGDKHLVYQSAVGKCILAFQPAKIQDVFKNKVKSDLPADSKSFFKELEQIKEGGFAVDNEKAEIGVRCVAAPIWRDGRVIAGIAISGPSVRVSKEMDEKNGELVKLFSQKITDSLENWRL